MAVTPSRIIDLANAYFNSCVLFASCDLGVYDFLAAHPSVTAGEVAKGLQLDSRAIRRLLDACAALGLVRKSSDTYELTEESATFLVKGSPGDLSAALRYNRDVYQAWGRLPEHIRTGKPVERPELHLGESHDRTRTFVSAMHGRALALGRVVVPQLDLAGRRRVLDIGGGPGTFSVLITQANPAVSCTVVDLPEIVAIAAELIEEQGASERVSTLPGDYHVVPFPEGNDVAVCFGMLHQETPESIQDILSRANKALLPGGVVYIMDMMTDATRTAPAFSTLFSLNMSLTTDNGWVFSDEDLGRWLIRAGFIDYSVAPVGGHLPHWLATARKPA
ncbi:MAG: methyltransferase domain-containing protein [Chitinivibrionales bacterium]|nr:methyltransferase domain-containing protein [Chitinivibrionales bacterium]MBD3356001.1 methyltransferase domain-containing protein [Chitinivibrionales bacterium]